MIARIEVKGYKCLRYVHQQLRHFQILAGPNASGKSTFLDAVLFVRDLLFDGVETAVRNRARTVRELAWKHESSRFEIALEFALPTLIRQSTSGENREHSRKYPYLRYEVAVADVPERGVQIQGENLWLLSDLSEPQEQPAAPRSRFPRENPGPETILQPSRRKSPPGWRKVMSRSPEGRVYVRSERTDWNMPLRPLPHRSGLTVIPEEAERFPASVWLRRFLTEGLKFLMLNSRAMKEPSPPDGPRTFQPDGANLALVVEHLRQTDPSRFQKWLAHVQTVLHDVQDISVKARETDRFRYLAVQMDGVEIPSWLLSDGTLRLLALTILPYLPDAGTVYFIEEPENGIHPRALESIYQALSSIYEGQVFCATHSPIFLNLAEPRDLLCFARTPSGATDIVRGDQHPQLQKWRGEVSLGDLLASGVLG